MLTLYNLQHSNEVGRQQAEQTAHRAAVDLAQRLALELQRAEWLAELDETEQFEIRAGALVIPAAVGFLAAPEPVLGDPFDLALDDKLVAAERAEFVAGDRQAAATTFDAVLASPLLSERRRAEVLVAAGWQAWRGEQTQRARELLGRVVEQPQLDAAVVESAVLLGAAVGADLPAQLDAGLRRLSPARAELLFERLRLRAVDTTGLELAVASTALWRERLRVVEQLVDHLVGAPGVVLRASGQRLLVYHPQQRGVGHGALVDIERAVALLQTRAVVVRAPLRYGPFATPVEPALVAVPGLLAALPVDPDRAASRPWLVAGSMVLLVFVFLGAMYSSMRSVRREAVALRARAEFMAVVTHELKTPLASIRLFAEMLEDGRVEASQLAEYYSLLSGEAGRLSLLIENVLDLGRIERGERGYDRREHRLDDLVGDAVEVLRPVVERDGLRFEVDFGAAETRVLVDRGAILQALLNVIDNARKYAHRGERLELSTRVSAGVCEVVVRDHGPGIPVAERERIFGRFERGALPQHDRLPGVGLGLHLARSMLRAHGGDLRCEDGVGGGARLVFTLVARVIDDEQ